MKAWLLPSLDGYEKLELQEVPDLVAGPGEAVLRLVFASLNPADAWMAKGQYPFRPSLPHVLGREGIGEIVSVGPDVKDIAIGQTKIILRSATGVRRFGTLAERVAVRVESLADVPTGWSAEQAAAGPLVYATAFQALTQWDDLPEKAIVLITGAAGGVGIAAVQLAQAMGHVVIGSSRSEAKRKRLREIGADQTIDPADAEWPKKLSATLNGVGVDLAIDMVAGKDFPNLVKSLAQRGRISVVGQSAGPIPNFKTGTLFFNRARIGGVAVDSYSPAEGKDAWQQVVRLLSRTNARPIVERVFEFDETKEAFRHLDESPVGKVVVRIS